MHSDSPFIIQMKIQQTLQEYEQIRGELTREEEILLQITMEYEQRYKEVFLTLWQEEQKKATAASRATATVLETMANFELDKQYQMLATRYQMQKQKVETLRNRLTSYKVDSQLLNQLTVLHSVEAKVSLPNL